MKRFLGISRSSIKEPTTTTSPTHVSESSSFSPTTAAACRGFCLGRSWFFPSPLLCHPIMTYPLVAATSSSSYSSTFPCCCCLLPSACCSLWWSVHYLLFPIQSVNQSVKFMWCEQDEKYLDTKNIMILLDISLLLTGYSFLSDSSLPVQKKRGSWR